MPTASRAGVPKTTDQTIAKWSCFNNGDNMLVKMPTTVTAATMLCHPWAIQHQIQTFLFVVAFPKESKASLVAFLVTSILGNKM